MTPARALFTLVTLAGFTIVAGSCGGSDEATGKNAGGAGGGLLEGGSGTAGSAGSRAGSGGGGSGGGDAGPSGTALGQACVNDAECDPDGMTGLTCMTSTETDLDGAAAPKGVCTLECSANGTCWAVDENALCITFGATGYCMEACLQGPPPDPPPEPPLPDKCHNRPEFACTPLDIFPTGTACTDVTDCPPGHACYDVDTTAAVSLECVFVIAACLPACTGDQDCAADLFCDRDTGYCMTESTAGDPLGAACDPTAATDTCSGDCQAVSDLDGVEGMCSEVCSFYGPCDYDAAGDPHGVCLFPTSINDDPGPGDFGFCVEMCDCTQDCQTPGFGCVASVPIRDVFDRGGLCVYPFEADGGMSETLEQCPGSGGSGGSGGTGSGSGGEGGA